MISVEFISYTGSLNVLIDAGVIISFREHEKIENPEQHEKLYVKKKSLHIFLNLAALLYKYKRRKNYGS